MMIQGNKNKGDSMKGKCKSKGSDGEQVKMAESARKGGSKPKGMSKAMKKHMKGDDDD